MTDEPYDTEFYISDACDIEGKHGHDCPDAGGGCKCGCHPRHVSPSDTPLSHASFRSRERGT